MFQKRTFRFYGLFFLFSALIFSGLTLQASAADYTKQTTIFGSAPATDAKADPVAPFTGGKERKAAHTMVTGEYPDVPYVDVVNFAGSVEEKDSNSLTLDCTLSKAENQPTLDRIADRIYEKSNGAKYDTVTINWHIGANPEKTSPWARTVMTRN